MDAPEEHHRWLPSWDSTFCCHCARASSALPGCRPRARLTSTTCGPSMPMLWNARSPSAWAALAAKIRPTKQADKSSSPELLGRSFPGTSSVRFTHIVRMQEGH
jgi:hypothetical protein